MTQTKLGAKLAAKSSAPESESKFAAAIAGARPFVPYRIDRLGLDTVITLCPQNRIQEIEGAVHARMRALGLELSRTTELNYESERAVRVLAEIVLDPVSKLPIGTSAEWASLDVDTISAAWQAAGDVREQYDPIDTPLTQEEMELITDAVKKNSPALLRLCGVRRLSLYLLTTADQRSSLPPPNSTSGE